MTRDGLRVAVWFLRSLVARRRRTLATPARRWLPLLVRGFYPDRWVTYDLAGRDLGAYLSDVEILRTESLNGPASAALDDKLLLPSLLPPRANVPRVLALVRDGRPVWRHDAVVPGTTLAELAEAHGGLVAKPRVGLCGRGVRRLDAGDAALDWRSLGAGEVLVCEAVRQGAWAARLYPRTVNTVRALTMLDPATGEPFLAGAVQRVGTAASCPVDNGSAGGVFCRIDPATGRLGAGWADHFFDRPLRRLDRHPDSGVVFAEQSVPTWDAVVREVLVLARALPSLPFVGWDLALLDDGVAVIEGNHWSELGWFQLERPLLADPRVRRFFEHHRVVRRRAVRGVPAA